jgi:hypothetical protein
VKSQSFVAVKCSKLFEEGTVQKLVQGSMGLGVLCVNDSLLGEHNEDVLRCEVLWSSGENDASLEGGGVGWFTMHVYAALRRTISPIPTGTINPFAKS